LRDSKSLTGDYGKKWYQIPVTDKTPDSGAKTLSIGATGERNQSERRLRFRMPSAGYPITRNQCGISPLTLVPVCASNREKGVPVHVIGRGGGIGSPSVERRVPAFDLAGWRKTVDGFSCKWSGIGSGRGA
jgi:hypothetical protein